MNSASIPATEHSRPPGDDGERRRGRRLSGAGRRRALISLTPLIDVVFILLVFFMLASSFLQWRSIDLNPPAEAAGAGMMGSVIVDVTTEGLRVSGEPVDAGRLAERVEAILSRRDEARVLVRAAAGVSAQSAVDVLDRLAAAGLSDMSLVGGAE